MIWQRALHVDPRAPLLTPNIATPAANTPGLEKDPRGPQQSASSRDEWRRSLGLSADSQIEEKEYGKLLDDEDVRRLKGFIRELTAQSLVPFMERSVQQWNEQVSIDRNTTIVSTKPLTKKMLAPHYSFQRPGVV